MPGTGPEAPAGVGGGVLPEEGARAVLLQPFPAHQAHLSSYCNFQSQVGAYMLQRKKFLDNEFSCVYYWTSSSLCQVA